MPSLVHTLLIPNLTQGVLGGFFKCNEMDRRGGRKWINVRKGKKIDKCGAKRRGWCRCGGKRSGQRLDAGQKMKGGLA